MKKYKIENKYILVEFLDVGATIIKLLKKENNTNYILSYDNIHSYKDNNYYFGSTIGRNAGRTFPARYQNFEGKHIKLDTNEGEIHLHGGNEGLHNKVWVVEDLKSDYAKLILYDNNGYYEDAQFIIEYFLDENTFTIQISGKSLVPTVMNLTNHMYFNLDSNQESIENHNLLINSDKIQVVNDNFVPRAELVPTLDNDIQFLNFNEVKRVHNAMNKEHYLSKLCLGGVDLAYTISGNITEPVVKLTDSKNINGLEIYSNQKAVVCYTLNKIDQDFNRKIKQTINKFQGITFEMQQLPNFTNTIENSLTDNYLSVTDYVIF